MTERDATPPRFPWRELMALGLGRLKLPGPAFWTMTPRELAAAAEGAFGPRRTPADRATLETLMRRYPDTR
jgi:uncharacterized phage protein (TIGR02216 family)